MLEKLKNLNSREKAGLVLAGVFLFLTAVNYGVVNPLVNQLRQIEADVEIEEQKIKIANSIIGQEETVENKYLEAVDKIYRYTSDDEAIDAMKGHIDDLAGETGLVINAMDHRSVAVNGNMGICMVDIGQFESDVNGLLKFLHAVRTAEGLMSVDKLVFNVDKEKGTLKGSVLVSRIIIRESAGEEKQSSE